jgi:hypothetical protein
LPPLTSRNDVDLQLYAFIAIIIRDYVQTWYGKITPDESFVTEIVQIIAHCTRALEQRLRKLDLEALLFDELPELLGRHVSGTSSELSLMHSSLIVKARSTISWLKSLTTSPYRSAPNRPEGSRDGN